MKPLLNYFYIFPEQYADARNKFAEALNINEFDTEMYKVSYIVVIEVC